MECEQPSNRIVVGIAYGLCAITLALSLYATRTPSRLLPDAAHAAVVARNLVRGDGYWIDFVPFHAGHFESVRHVPEMHGLLQPVVLAPFFALFGVEDASVRIPGLVYVALTGLVAFYFARRLFGELAGLAACVVSLSSATLFWIGAQGLDDAGFAFFALFGVSLLERAVAGQRPRDFALAGALLGLALLAKPLGLFLPGLLLVSLLRLRDRGARDVLRGCALFALPFAAALTVYLLRNYLAHGGLGFRFGALEWVFKTAGFEGFFALHPVPPTLGEVVAPLGFAGVVALQWEQVQRFLEQALGPSHHPLRLAMVSPWWLTPLGIASALLHLRARPVFACLVLLCVLGSVAFVSLLYHFEARYFAMLGPLFAVSVAGLPALGRGLASRWRRASAALQLGAWLLIAALAVQNASQLLRPGGVTQVRIPKPPLCPQAVEWIRASTAADDAVLVLHPASYAWRLERPTVMIPSGGLAPILEVSRRYDARWLLGHRVLIRPWTSASLQGLQDERGAGYAIEEVFAADGCRVHRILLDPTS